MSASLRDIPTPLPKVMLRYRDCLEKEKVVVGKEKEGVE